MTTERPILGIFGDPWPTEVTEENLIELGKHLREGESPEASAALIIYEEDTVAILNEIATWMLVSPKEASERIRSVNGIYYRRPAAILLAAEKYRTTGEVHEDRLDFMKGVGERSGLFGDVFFRSFIMSQDAETQLLLERVNRVWQSEGPLKAYDTIVDYEKLRPLAKEDPNIQVALEKSRQRFYQLCPAAQQLSFEQ